MKLVGRVKVADVKEKGLLRLEFPPFDICVAWVDGEVFAIEDACNHAGAALSEGWVEDKCVVCPMHGYVFDLTDGKLLRPRGLCGDQRRYDVKIEGDEAAIYDVFNLLITP